MIKKSYSVQMSYKISDEEKSQAEKCLKLTDVLLSQLKKSLEHLSLMYNPFKEDQSSTPEQIFAKRVALRRYRDQCSENFNLFKKIAFRCYLCLQYFKSDTQSLKLVKSLVSSIDDLEKQVNRFLALFSDLKSPEFGKTLLVAIDNIKKESAELEQIVEDRIVPHLQNNILSRNWVDAISKDLDYSSENTLPYTSQLAKERENKINHK